MVVISFDCEKCKGEIKDYKNRVQILDDNGFTHSYCQGCGQQIKEQIDARQNSTK